MNKKKLTISIVIGIALLATAVITVNSMLYGNIDGVWGLVDDGTMVPMTTSTGATCLRYADGISGATPNPDYFSAGVPEIAISFGTPAVQRTKTTNWNQVRYGSQDWRYYTCGDSESLIRFRAQSGLAFNGVDASTIKREAGNMVPFPLGKLCHVNKSIYADNDLEMTYVDLTISGVECGDNGTLVKDKAGNPLPGNPTSIDIDLSFLVHLDETPNRTPCKYPSTDECADAIIPGQTEGDNFFCKYVNNGIEEVKEYTISIIGFTLARLNPFPTPTRTPPGFIATNTPLPTNTPTPGGPTPTGPVPTPTPAYAFCEDAVYNRSVPMPGLFISQEYSTNCACVWAVVTEYEPLVVEMNFFEASAGEQSIVLRWQTAFETDNIGFNVYRSETLIREDAVQLNQELIASLVPPGSTFGADYEFIDNSALPYTTYFYWIEDVDVNGTITTHGPVRAEWVD